MKNVFKKIAVTVILIFNVDYLAYAQTQDKAYSTQIDVVPYYDVVNEKQEQLYTKVQQACQRDAIQCNKLAVELEGEGNVVICVHKLAAELGSIESKRYVEVRYAAGSYFRMVDCSFINDSGRKRVEKKN